MKFRVIAVVFVLSALLMLGTVYLDEMLLAGITWAYIISGVAVATMLAIRLYVYSGVLLGFHVGMAAFTTWVFINRDIVVEEPTFVFSTFTDGNLQMAIVTLVATSLAVFLPCVAIARDRKSLIQAPPQALVYELLGQLDRVPLGFFQLVLFASFFLSVLFFQTNTSVLEVSYPFQVSTHWVPWEIKKVPTLMAAVALVFAYAQHLQRRRGFANWLLPARVIFLIVSVLMLLITGSRGMFTFLWLGFGVLELLLWRKRRGSLGWAVLFVALAWFAYQSWPYMRWNLSLLPMGGVVTEAFKIGLGLSSNDQLLYVGERGIWLGKIAMIGASLFHLLYVIELIRDGVSLGGSTFVNLIPQALPSWLDGVFWERPLNDNWRLAEQYYHSGGFLIVANAYWNGGLGVVVAFMAALSSLFTAFDRYLMKPGTGMLYRFAYWLWLPVMVVQLGYGIQGLIRVVQLLVAMMLLDRFLRHRTKRRARAQDRRLPWSHPDSDGALKVQHTYWNR